MSWRIGKWLSTVVVAGVHAYAGSAAAVVVSGEVSDVNGAQVEFATVTFTSETDPLQTASDVTDDFGVYRVILDLRRPTAVGEETSPPSPSTVRLLRNYPNPFNPSTAIPYELSEGTHIRLTIYNVVGQPVRTLVDGPQTIGYHRVHWDGRDDHGRGVAAGVFIVRMETERFAQSRKLVMLDGAAGAFRSFSTGGPARKPAQAPPQAHLFTVRISGDDIEAFTQNGVAVWSDTTIGFTVTAATVPAIDREADMIFVQEGVFTMGSDEGFPDEQPPHLVTLSSYWIDEFEVTTHQYESCTDAGGCTPAAQSAGCNSGMEDRGDHPINCVTWEQAQSYCGWAQKRLATEAEWEKAARGTDRRRFPWGDAPPSSELLNYANNIGSTTPVGTYHGLSFYGLHDMGGNVSEWTADFYDPDYYANSPSMDPLGPDDGSTRVARGANWTAGDFALEPLTTSARLRLPPTLFDAAIGFRCVADHAADGSETVLPATTPEFLIDNLGRAFNNADGTLYASLFHESFWFTENDAEVLSNVVDGKRAHPTNSGCLLHLAVDEWDTLDDLGDELVAVESVPVFLRIGGQFEDHAKGGYA